MHHVKKSKEFRKDKWKGKPKWMIAMNRRISPACEKCSDEIQCRQIPYNGKEFANRQPLASGVHKKLATYSTVRTVLRKEL